MKEINSNKGFFDRITKWRGVIIVYGTGVWGKALYDRLQAMGIKVDFFAVSLKDAAVPASIAGIEVKEIKELKYFKETALVLLAGGLQMQCEAEKLAEKLGYVNRLPIDKEEFYIGCLEDGIIPAGKKICPICGNNLALYIPYGKPLRYNAQCPKCESLERHRELWLFLQERGLLKGRKTVLHFAPEKCLLDKFIRKKDIDYYPVDINEAMYGIREVVDITDIPYKEGMFDLIICNHVIEHIENERRALSEMERVLAESGIAIINAPVSSMPVTLEIAEYNTPELRAKYYGQADHVRKYGKDYIKHLEQEFEVEEVDYCSSLSKEIISLNGLSEGQSIYLCRKSRKEKC